MIPDKNTQRNILSVLNCLQGKIENNNKINRNLAEQLRSIVDHFIEGLEEYDVRRLDEVAECQNGHAFYKEGYDEEGEYREDHPCSDGS